MNPPFGCLSRPTGLSRIASVLYAYRRIFLHAYSGTQPDSGSVPQVVEEFMSIADGQTVLAGGVDLAAGVAVDARLSVSRIGSRAFPPPLRSLAPHIRCAAALLPCTLPLHKRAPLCAPCSGPLCAPARLAAQAAPGSVLLSQGVLQAVLLLMLGAGAARGPGWSRPRRRTCSASMPTRAPAAAGRSLPAPPQWRQP